MKIRTVSNLSMWGLGVAFVASCSASGDDSRRILVTEPNELGVTELRIERLVDNGNSMFVLRGLAANEQELASVQLTIGEIPELSSYLAGTNDYGSEIVVSANAQSVTTRTRATARFELDPDGQTPAMSKFLQLSTVSTTLAKEADIKVDPSLAIEDERTYSEYCPDGPCEPPLITSWVQTCPAVLMNTTPPAKQCCYHSDDTGEKTRHVGVKAAAGVPAAVTDNTTVLRNRAPACRTQEMDTKCTGQFNALTNPGGCFYGPNGFGIASTVSPPGGTPYGFTGRNGGSLSGGYRCYTGHAAAPQTSFFQNVNGQNVPGQQDCCQGNVFTTASQGCCGGAIYSTASLKCCVGTAIPIGNQCIVRGQATPAQDDADRGMWEY